MNSQDPERKGARGAASLHDSALELFQTAAMFLGKEQEAVSVVEEVVTSTKSDPCLEPLVAHREARERVIAAALKRMGQLPSGGLDAERAAGGVSENTCIESDDLSAAGLTPKELDALIEGPGRVRLRQWLDLLSPAMRAVFVLRAMLGKGNDETAATLRASGAPGAAGWIAPTVSQVFRQALCSLATSLLQSGQAGLSSAKA
jgi:hypothetical protein